MKVLIWILALVGVLVVGPATTFAGVLQQTAATNDKTLDEQIERRIKSDQSLRNHDIDVSVRSGVVTLKGTVASDNERARAAELANVSGVTRVDNQIVVDATSARKGTAGTLKEKTKEGAAKTKEGAGKTAEKTKEGTGKAAEKTKGAVSKTGEVITDTWITGRVKSRFVGEDLLKDSDINVDTNDHVVTLKGTVMSAAGRAKAVAIAKNTEGVRRVVDQLTVGPKTKG